MTETLEKKGMTLITDSFVCRTLQFQERLEKLLYDIHTEFPEKVYSLELLFENGYGRWGKIRRADQSGSGTYKSGSAALGNDRRMAA